MVWAAVRVSVRVSDKRSQQTRRRAMGAMTWKVQVRGKEEKGVSPVKFGFVRFFFFFYYYNSGATGCSEMLPGGHVGLFLAWR